MELELVDIVGEVVLQEEVDKLILIIAILQDLILQVLLFEFLIIVVGLRDTMTHLLPPRGVIFLVTASSKIVILLIVVVDVRRVAVALICKVLALRLGLLNLLRSIIILVILLKLILLCTLVVVVLIVVRMKDVVGR